MIVKASLYGAKIAEVPITLHRDGRKSNAPHLKTFRDGWRTLRFFLMLSPRWLFLVPGGILVLLGLVGYALALPGLTVWGATLDAHTLLFATLSIMCGYQSILFALFTKVFAISEGLLPKDKRLTRLFEIVTLENALVVAVGALVTGLLLLLVSVYVWKSKGFGPLDYRQTMRIVIPGSMITALGFQTILASFFMSILALSRK